MLSGAHGAVAAAEPCADLVRQSNAQLEAMRRHAAGIENSLQRLNEALLQAEHRNAEQTREIERLQAELLAQDPHRHDAVKREFYRALRRRLPMSALYEVLSDRLIIASDPVFIFGKGELGAEGHERLMPLADVLQGLVPQLPAQSPWRLRIEGHSDRRPLRANPYFESNWELSASRALSMLRFLVDQGLDKDRLSAVGLAETRLRDAGQDKSAHRRNRRIEVHLEFADAAAP